MQAMLLETERLILRKLTVDDLEDFASLMADEEVMRFSVSGPIKSREQVAELFQKRILDHYAHYGYGLYAAVHKTDRCLIGFVGVLTQNIDGQERPELGYRLFPKYWRQGFATEACQAVCNYAFNQLGIGELISIIEPQNIKSIAVAERIGMHFWKEAIFHNLSVKVFTLPRKAC